MGLYPRKGCYTILFLSATAFHVIPLLDERGAACRRHLA